MTGIYDRMYLYDAEQNPSLKYTKNLVPRIVKYGGDTFGFCLVEKHHLRTYYCFLTKYGMTNRETYLLGDAIEKLSLVDYFKISYILRSLGFKFNLKKIIYDSNRNK